jgi:4-amino-4-deoxy-L-arabinose transferase-like glycosyltransferase
MTERKKELLLLSILLATAFLVRLWLIPHRWVSPDEGAHLMDARLILEGLVPGVDFRSRGVLYGHILAAALSIVGPNLFLLRVFPVLAMVASGFLVHLIGRELFDWRTGIVAAGLFLFLPFSVFMTVFAKMEPWAMLFACGAAYCVTRSLDGSATRYRFHFLAGLCLGAAFYVRESAVAVAAALLLIVVLDGFRRNDAIRSGAMVVCGMAAVVGAVGLYYLRVLSFQEVVLEVPNPASFVWEYLRGALHALLSIPENSGSGNGMGGELIMSPDRLPLSRSLASWLDASRTSAVLGVGLVVSVGLLIAGPGDDEDGPQRFPLGFLLCWLAAIALAYGFWTVRRGFYPAYFLEFYAPLALLTAVGVTWALRHLEHSKGWQRHGLPLVFVGLLLLAAYGIASSWQISRPLYLVIAAIGLAPFYIPAWRELPRGDQRTRWLVAISGVLVVLCCLVFLGPNLPRRIGIPLYFASVPALIGGLYLVDPDPWRRKLRRIAAFGSYALLVAAFFLSLSASSRILGFSYHVVWSPETLRAATGALRSHTERDESVLSGGVIWALQADRLPFANVSHPLAYRGFMSEAEQDRLRRELSDDPPGAIVLDGYTEQTLLPWLAEVTRLLEEDYVLIFSTDSESAHRRVAVYVREQ